MFAANSRTNASLPLRRPSGSSGNSFKSRRDSSLSGSTSPHYGPIRSSAHDNGSLSRPPVPPLPLQQVPPFQQTVPVYQNTTTFDMTRQPTLPSAIRLPTPYDVPRAMSTVTPRVSSYGELGNMTIEEAMDLQPGELNYGEVILRRKSDIKRRKRWYRIYESVTSSFRRIFNSFRTKISGTVRRRRSGPDPVSFARSSGWHFRDETPSTQNLNLPYIQEEGGNTYNHPITPPPPLPLASQYSNSRQQSVPITTLELATEPRQSNVYTRDRSDRDTTSDTGSPLSPRASHPSRHTTGSRSRRSYRPDSFQSRRNAYAHDEPPVPPTADITFPIPAHGSTRPSFIMPSARHTSDPTTHAERGSRTRDNSRRSSRFSFASSKGESLLKLIMQLYRGLVALYNLPWVASPPKRVAIDFVPAMAGRSLYQYRRTREPLPLNVVEAAKEAREMIPADGKSWYKPSPEQLRKRPVGYGHGYKNHPYHCSHPAPQNQLGDRPDGINPPIVSFPQPQPYNWGSADLNQTMPAYVFTPVPPPAAAATAPNAFVARVSPQYPQYISMPQPMLSVPNYPPPPSTMLGTDFREPAMHHPQSSVANAYSSSQTPRPGPRPMQTPTVSGQGGYNGSGGRGSHGPMPENVPTAAAAAPPNLNSGIGGTGNNPATMGRGDGTRPTRTGTGASMGQPPPYPQQMVMYMGSPVAYSLSPSSPNSATQNQNTYHSPYMQQWAPSRV